MEFGELGFAHLSECFTVSLNFEIYKTHFLEKRPNKMPRISQYGICFLGALDGLLRNVTARGPQHKLSVVLEAGHKNASNTTDLFKDRKQQLDAVGIDTLRSHSLVSKKDSSLL
jgi:hypothetical protein